MSASLDSEFLADRELRELILAAEERDARSSELLGLSRRSFLKLVGVTGGGLVLAFSLSSCSPLDGGGEGAQAADEFAPNAFLRVSPDGSILIYSKGPEIGQGIKTSFAMIVAEELDADWSRVRVEQARIDPAVYGRQSAGGSRSIPAAWDQLRRAGAAARSMLVAAAAKEWGVPESECRTEKSRVLHAPSRRELGYGELANRRPPCPSPTRAGSSSRTERTTCCSARASAASTTARSSPASRSSASTRSCPGCSTRSTRSARPSAARWRRRISTK